jgi:integrase
MVKTNREHVTWSGYEQRVRLHITPVLGSRPLAKLGPNDIQRLLDAKLTSGLSPRSVQYIHATLRAALGVARRWGIVDRNVAELVNPVTVRRTQVQPFTPDEVQRILEVCATDRLGAFYTVAMAIGVRLGEGLGLCWTDVDIDGPSPQLRIHRAMKVGPDGRLLLGETKTPRSRRTVPLPAVCVSALRVHRQRQREERLAAGPLWQEHGLVFTTAGALRSTSLPCPTVSTTSRPPLACPATGSTTPGTRQRRCCWPRGWHPGSSWRSSGTAPTT